MMLMLFTAAGQQQQIGLQVHLPTNTHCALLASLPRAGGCHRMKAHRPGGSSVVTLQQVSLVTYIP